MNFYIFILSIFFSLEETAYFGWNLTPKTPEEVICDGIAILIFALAFVAGGKK